MIVSELGQYIQDKIVAKFGEGTSKLEIHYDFPVLIVSKSLVYDLLDFLKNDESLAFNYLTTMCGAHYPNAHTEMEFGLMYQLHNFENNNRVRIKVFMPKSDLNMKSMTPLWPAANWMEREAYDFYGFIFTGHPNLKRILNMEDMNYHPMRKEYPLEDATRHDKEDKYFGR
jgi:NADH-quinone oxidoreductase subunit C